MSEQASDTTALGVRVTPGLLARRILLGLLTYVLLRAKGLLSLPILTRLLGPDGMGVIALAGATANLVWPLAVLGLHSGLSVQAVHIRSQDGIKRAYSSVLLVTITTSLVAAGALLGAIHFFGPSLGLAQLRPYALAVAVYVITSGLKEVALVIPQVAQRTTLVSTLNLTVGFGSTAVAILLVLRGIGPEGPLWAEGLSYLVGGIWAVAYTMHLFGFSWRIDWAFIKSCLVVALPVLPVSAGQWVVQTLGSYFIAYYHGGGAVGVYSVAITLASLVLAVNAALNFVFFPSAGALYQKGMEHFTAFSMKTMRLTAYALGLACVGAALLAPWGVRLVAGAAFDGAVPVVPWVVAGYAAWTLTMVMQAFPLIVERSSGPIAWTYLITALLNIGLNFLLIPRIGMLGAAVATTLSYGAGYLLMGRVAWRLVPSLKHWRTLAWPWVPAVMLLPLALRWPSPAGAALWDPIGRTALLLIVYLGLGLSLRIVGRSDWQSLRTGGESGEGPR